MCCTCKHVFHVRDKTDIPTRNICIKQSRPSKHSCHTDHLARVPPRDILIEAWLKQKEMLHASDLTHVPIRHVRRTSRSAVCKPRGTTVFSRRDFLQTPIDSCAQSTLTRERRPLSTSAETSTGDQEKRTNDRGSQEAAPHIVSLPRSGKKSRICGYGILGLRYSPATRAQTDRRQISAVCAS